MGDTYCFGLKQHIGIKSRAIVKVDDLVKRGALIAKSPEDSLGTNLHTSISGVVTRITDDYIEIKADEEQTDDYVPISGETKLDLIKAAGIVGMGGAGFPTDVKLGTDFKQNGLVIINAAECEPVLSHNEKSIEENPARVYNGLKYAMEVVNANKGIIAIKKKNIKAIQAINEVIEDDNIKVFSLEDIYPMGEERALIREVLGDVLEPTKLPLEVNCIVINSETASRITDAIELKKPFITKDITVAGRLQNEELIQVFLDVPLGKSVQGVLEMAGGVNQEYGELIMGGPFTGSSTDLEQPISKTSGGVIATTPFLKESRPMGLLVCACGSDDKRLEEIAQKMGANVVGVEYCKQAQNIKGTLKCENPGKCPGQAQKVMALKSNGAQSLLISNCTDCSNTVMSIAPKLKMTVYHCTDGALRAVNHKLIRKAKISK